MEAGITSLSDAIKHIYKYYLSDTSTIEMQKFGFSRELALYIQKKHSDCLTFSEGDLDSIDFAKLFGEFDQDNVLYEELKEYKYAI